MLFFSLIMSSARDKVNQIDNDLSPLMRTPGLDSDLDKLQNLLASLTEVYNAKKDAKKESTSPTDKGQKNLSMPAC